MAVVVYLNCLGNDFTQDDFRFIVNNDSLHLPFWRLFLTPYSQIGLYRPLAVLTFAINYALGGLHPAGYHFVNAVLHAGTVVLLYLLLEELLKKRQAAFVAALLFAVHPIHTEVVAAIVGRMEIMAAGFLFAAWLLHVRGRVMFAALCFLMAALSKETGLVFLALATMGDYVLERTRAWRSYAIYAAAAAVYMILRQSTVALGLNVISTLDNPLAALPPVLRIANALHVSGLYLALQVFPARLSAEYSANAILLHSSWRFVLFAVLLNTAILTAWLSCFRRNPAIFLAGCIYGAGFALTANILFPIGTIMGERLAYLPSAGFCLLAGIGWEWLQARRRKAAMALLVLVTIALAARTVIRNYDWRDNLALFTSAVQVVPESAKAHYGLGAEYLKRRELDKADKEFRTAARIFPGNPEIGMAMGVVAFLQGDRVRAGSLIENAVRASADNPNHLEMLTTYAALLLETRRFDEAATLLDRVIAGGPPSSRAYANRAVVHYYRREMDQARRDAEKAIKIDPSNEQALGLLKRLQAKP